MDTQKDRIVAAVRALESGSGDEIEEARLLLAQLVPKSREDVAALIVGLESPSVTARLLSIQAISRAPALGVPALRVLQGIFDRGQGGEGTTEAFQAILRITTNHENLAKFRQDYGNVVPWIGDILVTRGLASPVGAAADRAMMRLWRWRREQHRLQRMLDPAVRYPLLGTLVPPDNGSYVRTLISVPDGPWSLADDERVTYLADEPSECRVSLFRLPGFSSQVVVASWDGLSYGTQIAHVTEQLAAFACARYRIDGARLMWIERTMRESGITDWDCSVVVQLEGVPATKRLWSRIVYREDTVPLAIHRAFPRAVLTLP